MDDDTDLVVVWDGTGDLLPDRATKQSPLWSSGREKRLWGTNRKFNKIYPKNKKKPKPESEPTPVVEETTIAEER